MWSMNKQINDRRPPGCPFHQHLSQILGILIISEYADGYSTDLLPLNIHDRIQQPAGISSLVSYSNCLWKIRNCFKSTSLEHLGSICWSAHKSQSCMLIVRPKTQSQSVWCTFSVLTTLLQAQIQMAHYCKTQIGHTCLLMLTEISRWRPHNGPHLRVNT